MKQGFSAVAPAGFACKGNLICDLYYKYVNNAPEPMIVC